MAHHRPLSRAYLRALRHFLAVCRDAIEALEQLRVRKRAAYAAGVLPSQFFPEHETTLGTWRSRLEETSADVYIAALPASAAWATGDEPLSPRLRVLFLRRVAEADQLGGRLAEVEEQIAADLTASQARLEARMKQ